MNRYQFLKSLSIALVLALSVSTAGFSPAQKLHSPVGPVAEKVLTADAFRIVDDVDSGLEAYDNEPLAERIPLVLVHGIGGTASRLFHWENFLAFAKQNPEFKAKYKVYLYHYDSTRSVPAISRDLHGALTGFIGSLGGRDIKILAYSEGGLLVRNALQDPYLDEHTLEVLAIATPFHGSPLANPEWLEQQTKTESPLSLVRMTRRLVYKITGNKYPTFREDFRWDNFDGAIPADQYVKSNGPMELKDYALARKKNFVTYGSYFGLEVDSSALARELELKKAPPREQPMFGNLFKKNFLFSMIRNNIGKLPLAVHTNRKNTQTTVQYQAVIPARDTVPVENEMLLMPEAIVTEAADGSIEMVAVADSLGGSVAAFDQKQMLEQQNVPLPGVLENKSTVRVSEPISMMMYNDGISPISSTLWLGRYTNTAFGVSQPVDKLWATLKSLRGNSNTRLFAGLDHRNWMDGETRTGETSLQDLLNPDEPAKTVFEWILYDLMS